ncbi:hypothetical protein [Streptomyces sp. NPDC057623]|uniref:hypothetical protein n=1 Tax=Streptomyces sp. NPDC057623 TaxID=3346187 RepID=UPI003694A221
MEKEAVAVMAANLARLLQRGRPVKLVDHTLELFGDYYGQVTEPVARKAVKYLYGEGGTPTTGVGGDRTRELMVLPPTQS